MLVTKREATRSKMPIPKFDGPFVITLGAWLGSCAYLAWFLNDRVKSARFWREHCYYWRERVAVLVERAKVQEERNAWLEQQLRKEQQRKANVMARCAVLKRQAMEVDQKLKQVAERERLVLRCMDADVRAAWPVLWIRALQIQHAWRRYVATRAYRSATVRIQAAWRRHAAVCE